MRSRNVTNEVNALPGVNHNEVFSLSSYRVLYARALPGALVSTPYMYPQVPDTQAGVDELRLLVRTHQDQLAGYVTYDQKGALILASFNEQGLDYKALFDGIQAIIQKHQDANTRFYASGAVMFAGYGYHYLGRIELIFLLAIALMLVILYVSLGRRTGWWAPIVTGISASIWGLGFVSLMKFNFDPVMLVIPFILTARDLSHGIQWHGRYYDELDRTDDKVLACVATADVMLRPGLLAVLANIAGIIFIAASDIPVLQQIGIGGAAWLGASLAAVFVGQPILASYLPIPQIRERGARRRPFYRPLADRLVALPTTPGLPRTGLIVLAGLFIVVGIASATRVRVGYQTPGTPIYRSDAKVNQDTAEISKFVPTNLAWVVVETPNYPSDRSNIGIKTLRMIDDLSAYLVSRGDAVAVIGFSTIASKPMNMLLHNGFPKYMAMPDNDRLSSTLWYFFFGASAPDEPQSFFAYSPSMVNACVRVLLADHTYARLAKLRADLDSFTRERLASDPQLKDVKLRYLGGEAGLYLATDDVVSHLNVVNVGLTLLAIFLCCAAVFRSLVAGVLFVLAGVAANFVAFIYMNLHTIGLTADTIALITLGIGLGVNYGIYTVARIRDEVSEGALLNDAVTAALSTTGVWVFATFAVMVGGIIPWVFSPLLFQNEMSVLLVLLMSANVVVGLLILPALIAWLRPRFITRYERSAGRTQQPAAPTRAIS